MNDSEEPGVDHGDTSMRGEIRFDEAGDATTEDEGDVVIEGDAKRHGADEDSAVNEKQVVITGHISPLSWRPGRKSK
ncbi:uncharacterized protein PHACADRAFT_262753 [Phanerochaete carnosa HHB-10118-sp]|uniref:Uncharacterized protein n=1 Tax=Phanerochaete carnosa (strain HHB-10118-sp) TaxID=650164 RepID=K5VVR0_PHACS|nr:uncharacterized protein PHACADRAFT_262753 [Phanerochaete carnosa HHB-10118-sp]EKM50875.1 hypothetical protein PHACADRAFT_262753 [Phanerochaete carnosa HHB-10118-sp]